jgi:hypothetical protein
MVAANIPTWGFILIVVVAFLAGALFARRM